MMAEMPRMARAIALNVHYGIISPGPSETEHTVESLR